MIMRTGYPIASTESGQKGLLWRAQKPTAATGCPIDFEQAAKFPVSSEGRADEGEAPGEAVAPLTQMGTEAQEHIPEGRGEVKLDTIIPAPPI